MAQWFQENKKCRIGQIAELQDNGWLHNLDQWIFREPPKKQTDYRIATENRVIWKKGFNN